MKKYLITSLSFFVIIFSSNILNAQDEFFDPKTTVGGYGELHYNYSKLEGKDATKKLDFHRFVLFFSHSWTEKWSFKAEVELEHNFVKSGQGELELEEAYINYHHSNYFGFQVGVILPSVGLINEFHEPPLFLGVERPEYSKHIIPTTWFGNGAAIYGNYEGFDYKVSVMEGLNSDKFSPKSGIRSGRQKGFKADAKNLLYNGRLDFTGIPGLKFGTSFTYNKATGDSTTNAISLFEIHTQYRANNIYADAEFGNISYDEGEVKSSRGYYIDFGYNIGNLFNCTTNIIPFVRYTEYNTASETKGGGDSEEMYQNKKWMAGLVVKPIVQVVFKMDYSQSKSGVNDLKTDLLNVGVGYMF